MIKLDRPDTPTILQANEQLWTSELLSAIAQYGSYTEIPSTIKESLIQHYRRDEIKAALLSSSYHKCAFCESPLSGGISIEVEHYAPKSLYPDKTFDWNNLLPACRKCNGHKASLDTICDPIVNPYVDEPNQYFEYDLMLIRPKLSSPSHSKAKRTERTLRLNDDRLVRPRSEIICVLSNYLNALAEEIDELATLTQPAAQRRKAENIQNSLAIIEGLASPSSKYSGFVNHYLKAQPIYVNAKQAVEDLLAPTLS